MNKLRRLAAAVALLLVLAPHALAELPPLIPREALFGNPERMEPRISPDGKYLAYLAPDERNVLQVWLRTLGRQDDRVLTADKKRGIGLYFWTYDGEHLVYLQDADGDENFHFYAVNIKSNAVRDLTPFEGVQVRLVARDPGSPNEILVTMNLKDPRKQDVYRINLKGGGPKLDTENPGSVTRWVADARLKVRAATAVTPDGGIDLLVREAADKPWKTVRHWGPDEQGFPVGFSADGKTLRVLTNHGANTMRFLAIDARTGDEVMAVGDPQYDVNNWLVHPARRAVQAISFYKEKLEWQVLDKSLAADFAAIAKTRSGEFNVIDRDLADNIWLISFATDDGPDAYYSYDRRTRAAKRLFSNRPKLEGLRLARMRPISYRSRDGLTVHGYLTVPAGVPAKDLPTVLLVHGGPQERDVWGFNPVVQWLANRGYAVLQVNFRGSSGYGRKFLIAGDREWAGKMHDDLIDGVNWIVSEGIADPKRIAIMGSSYGGYAALVGLTFTPDVFAAGVDGFGPSNLVTLLKSIPPYWAPIRARLIRRVGDPEKDEQLLKSKSPLFFVDRIRSPLLIVQGANDPRVKRAESEQIVEAMRRAGKPVKYIVYADEGHGLERPENLLHFYAEVEKFLARHLGGRFEPVGEIKGHSGVITSVASQ
jgi:dipeptidyl aminopeptidase/acylaminoacyl peptidase